MASRSYPASQDLLDVNFARHAELLGLRGIRVETPDAIGAAWDAALSADRPTVIDATVDPTVPPLPPELTEKQQQAIEKALADGDPEAETIRSGCSRKGIASPQPDKDRTRPSSVASSGPASKRGRTLQITHSMVMAARHIRRCDNAASQKEGRR